MLRGSNFLNLRGDSYFGNWSNWFLFFFWFFFLFLFFLIFLFRLNFLFSEREVTLLIRFKESCHMKNSIAFNNKSDLIKKGDEDIDGCMSFIFRKGGNKEFSIIFLNPKCSRVFWGWGKDDISEREYFSLTGFSLIRTELIGLSLREDFSKEHDCW